jgi:hypothetical protein
LNVGQITGEEVQVSGSSPGSTALTYEPVPRPVLSIISKYYLSMTAICKRKRKKHLSFSSFYLMSTGDKKSKKYTMNIIIRIRPYSQNLCSMEPKVF